MFNFIPGSSPVCISKRPGNQNKLFPTSRSPPSGPPPPSPPSPPASRLSLASLLLPSVCWVFSFYDSVQTASWQTRLQSEHRVNPSSWTLDLTSLELWRRRRWFSRSLITALLLQLLVLLHLAKEPEELPEEVTAVERGSPVVDWVESCSKGSE